MFDDESQPHVQVQLERWFFSVAQLFAQWFVQVDCFQSQACCFETEHPDLLLTAIVVVWIHIAYVPDALHASDRYDDPHYPES